MKNNNLIFLCIFMTVFSCTKKRPELLIHKWAKNDTISVVERQLANTEDGRCMKNIFNVETLKAQVRELERPFNNAPRVRGQWKHLDLSTLPVPQANFLSQYGSFLGDQKNPGSIDYSSCSDVPCIYNKIYDKEDSVAGYVHYIWYLKLGHMLSADNRIPEQTAYQSGTYKGKSWPLSSYLYDDKELYGLWRLTHMLKPPFTNLKYLKEVQRLPRGTDFEDRVKPDDMKGVCGVAYSQGHIVLADGCLRINRDMDSGSLYTSVIHELAHHIDFQQGRGSPERYRSHKKDYLELAGVNFNEYMNAQNQFTQDMERKEPLPVVSAYAATSPQDNFAETLAYFRLDGDYTKKVLSKKHYEFTSGNYYQNSNYEIETMMKGWLEKYSTDIDKEVLRTTVDCRSISSDKSKMFNCMTAQMETINSLIKGKVKFHEADGCKTLTPVNTRSVWDPLLKSSVEESIDRHINDERDLSQLAVYYDRLKDKSFAQNAYVSCFGESNEKSCYEEQIKFDLGEMASTYLKQYPFTGTQAEMKAHYALFVSSSLQLVKQAAQNTWLSCAMIQHNDEEIPTGSHFRIGNDYMVSSFYNCLNVQIPDDVKEIVRGFSIDGMKLQHAKEELILFQEVLPVFVSELKEIYRTEKEKERMQPRSLRIPDVARFKASLRNSDCITEAVKLAPELPLYHTKRELYEGVAKKLCARL